MAHQYFYFELTSRTENNYANQVPNLKYGKYDQINNEMIKKSPLSNHYIGMDIAVGI
jgi:hypothetical protein